MSVTLDGDILFDRQQLKIEPGSFNRSTMERAAPGLDGVLSIDLGGRGRKIKQTGTLRTKSRAQMNDRINSISAYLDGNTHTLITGTGQEFDNLRMDSFTLGNERTDGSSIVVDYEIMYMQLL